MTFVAQVIARTPFQVWLLFTFFVWQGIQALKPRTMRLPRLFLVPLLFIASGVLPLLLGSRTRTDLLAIWGLVAVLLAPMGFLTGPRLLAVDRRTGTVTRPGSAVPLVRNVTVFVVQYLIAVATAIHAEGAEWLPVVSRAVSGATAGYFLGWAVSAWRQVRLAGAPGASQEQ